MCRYRRELSDAYFLAKFGFDTAENEPSTVSDAELEEVEDLAHLRVEAPPSRHPPPSPAASSVAPLVPVSTLDPSELWSTL